MNVFLNIKLIARNWWRNKLFFLISLFSLTAGLGCTNLLMTFFIHEYNVEKYNTDRNLIYLLRQDSPMEEGIKVAYSTSDAATQIKEKYAEITDILHVNGMSGNLCKYNGTDIKQFLFIIHLVFFKNIRCFLSAYYTLFKRYILFNKLVHLFLDFF